MSHVIPRLSLRMAQVSLLTALLCPCGAAFAQGLKFSGGGDAGGFFTGNDQLRTGSSLLSLEIALSLERNTSSALFYATSHPQGEEKRFAYLCLVTHRFAGNAQEVAGNFRCRLHVLDGDGELELSGGADRSSFNIMYSTAVKRNTTDESLTVCKLPIDLARGRVFFVDISGDTPLVDQVNYPLPDAPARAEAAEKARKVLNDIKESIAAGHTNKLALKCVD